jgi:hypothetical protein
MTFYPFPSIDQYLSVIKEVNYLDKEKILDFRGTVKIHGTNASIVATFVKNEKDEYINQSLYCQSRNKIITIEKDNVGFAAFVNSIPKEKLIKVLFYPILETLDVPSITIIIYGEWCGKGIQKGVGVSELPKMFVTYSILIVEFENDNLTVESGQGTRIDPIALKNWSNCPDSSIYNIFMFPVYNITINFNVPQFSQNKLVTLTNEVETECPVAKYFGVSGIGEGIVYICTHPDFQSSRFWFKVKGKEHSVSKVKSLKSIAAVDIEKVQSITEFIDCTVTENRLKQGIEYLLEMNLEISKKNTGTFLQWVTKDVLKEEKDRLVASNLNENDVKKHINIKANNFFGKYFTSI